LNRENESFFSYTDSLLLAKAKESNQHPRACASVTEPARKGRALKFMHIFIE